MKSVVYNTYEPNADLTDTSDDITCFLDTVKYSMQLYNASFGKMLVFCMIFC